MQSIKVRQRVGADGILHLEIPTEIHEDEVEVTITYQKLAPQEVDERGWPIGFLSEPMVSARMTRSPLMMKVFQKH